MADFITLTCPSCGGKLQLTDDIERFACGYCGTEHIVRRNGGIVSLAPVIESLSRVQVSTDKTASELAITRLKSEIIELEGRYRQLQNEMSKTKSARDPVVVGFIAGIFLLAAFLSVHEWTTALLCGIPLLLVSVAMGFFIAKGRKLTKQEIEKHLAKLAKEIDKKRSELKRQQDVVSL